MQKAQRIIKTYRRNRMIVCTICALVTLASTLSVRFISQRNLNQQRVVQFANHAVEELDKVLLPLQAGSEVLLPLIGLPCSVAHLPLRKQAAKLQTVRSIGLVQDGTLYCSSIFGYRNVPVVDILAELPAPQPLLRLTIDRALKTMKTIRFLRNAFLLPLTLMVRGLRRWHGTIFQHNYRWRCC